MVQKFSLTGFAVFVNSDAVAKFRVNSVQKVVRVSEKSI